MLLDQYLEILLVEVEVTYLDFKDICEYDPELRMINGKSPLRIKLENYEKDINRIWSFVLNKYNKKHVYDLPKEAYNFVCNYISYKGKQLIKQFIHLAYKWILLAEHYHLKYKYNPYIVGIYCLLKKYNIFHK